MSVQRSAGRHMHCSPSIGLSWNETRRRLPLVRAEALFHLFSIWASHSLGSKWYILCIICIPSLEQQVWNSIILIQQNLTPFLNLSGEPRRSRDPNDRFSQPHRQPFSAGSTDPYHHAPTDIFMTHAFCTRATSYNHQ